MGLRVLIAGACFFITILGFSAEDHQPVDFDTFLKEMTNKLSTAHTEFEKRLDFYNSEKEKFTKELEILKQQTVDVTAAEKLFAAQNDLIKLDILKNMLDLFPEGLQRPLGNNFNTLSTYYRDWFRYGEGWVVNTLVKKFLLLSKAINFSDEQLANNVRNIVEIMPTTLPPGGGEEKNRQYTEDILDWVKKTKQDIEKLRENQIKKVVANINALDIYLAAIELNPGEYPPDLLNLLYKLLDQHNEQKEELEKEISERKAELAGLVESVTNAKKDLKEAQDALNLKSNEVQGTVNRLNQIQTQVKEVESAHRKTLDDLEKRHTDLKKENKNLERRVEEKKQLLDEAFDHVTSKLHHRFQLGTLTTKVHHQGEEHSAIQTFFDKKLEEIIVKGVVDSRKKLETFKKINPNIAVTFYISSFERKKGRLGQTTGFTVTAKLDITVSGFAHQQNVSSRPFVFEVTPNYLDFQMDQAETESLYEEILYLLEAEIFFAVNAIEEKEGNQNSFSDAVISAVREECIKFLQGTQKEREVPSQD
ncbi:MAG: hypothetical protein AB7F43_01135 [Bacteriovoracia bacterium]